MARAATQENIYGEVNSQEDIRRINRKIRDQMEDVRQREDLTELKKRSDYLCALAMAPAWKEKFGRDIDGILRTAKEEDRRSAKFANEVAERHGWDADYDPWGGN
jgi:hypothetical protein